MKTVTQADSPKWKFGSGDRIDLGVKEVKAKPGPGTYDQKWAAL